MREKVGRNISFYVYRAGAALLGRVPLRLARQLAGGAAYVSSFLLRDQYDVVTQNLSRVLGSSLQEPLKHQVRRSFFEYGRYWSDVSHLERIPSAHLEDLFTPGGLTDFKQHLGSGASIFALPHLGCWEIAGLWAFNNGLPMTTVAEPASTPQLTRWFEAKRARLGLRVLGLGGATVNELLATLRSGHMVALLADRDVVGDGVEVEFFGRRTRVPAGPAMLAIRAGVPLFPTTVYLEHDGLYRAVIRPAIPTDRAGRLRDDIQRVTQALAHEFEILISAAPTQWHVFQPNWVESPDPARVD